MALMLWLIAAKGLKSKTPYFAIFTYFYAMAFDVVFLWRLM